MPQLDTSVELSLPDNNLLRDIYHMRLEVSVNGQVVDKADLYSRESVPGVWDANAILVLYVFLTG
jgi:hypothetical protein